MGRHAEPAGPGRGRRRLAVAGGLLLALGGGGALVLALGPGGPPASVVATWSPAPPPTSTVSTSPTSAPRPPPGPGSAPVPTEALEPAPEAPPLDPSTLSPLTAAQRGDPEAVAERFLVTYASFDPSEDRSGLDARLAELATPALGEELGRGSSASAALDDLRQRKVAFAGEVVDISVAERSGARTVVEAVVEHITVVDGVAQPDFRLTPYTLTLVTSGPGWLVAGLTQ